MSAASGLRDRFERGLAAPICLTWELTYACNLACSHCLSSSGRRDPRELSTAEAVALIDELADLKVFYVNVGGGEPTIRRDFFDLVDHAVERRVGVKFSTNGTRIDAAAAERLAATDYVDVQVSIDGADARDQRRDPRRGQLRRGARGDGPPRGRRGSARFKVSVVVTRDNVAQLDDLARARRRLRRDRCASRGCARPGRGARGLGRPAPHARAVRATSTSGCARAPTC